MRHQLLLFSIAAAVVLAADPPVRQRNSTTQHVDLPANGTLHVSRSFGELTIEGWDRPEVEATTIRIAATNAAIDSVHITAERKGNEAVVTTSVPKSWFPRCLIRSLPRVDVEYRIKAPRSAKIVIDQLQGEVHLTNLTGDVHVTDKKGQITMSLAPDADYAVDAFTKLGAVDSDLAGKEQSKIMKLGHAFLREAPSGKPKLYLRIGYGDITLFEESKPRPAVAK